MDFGLFLLHAVVGLFFVGHGAQKLFGAFGGHGLEGTAGFFDSLGLRPGRLHARAAGVNELVGGALLALGLFVPFAATLIVATMVAAVITVHASKGPWNSDGGWELNATYAVAAVALAGRRRGPVVARPRPRAGPGRHRVGPGGPRRGPRGRHRRGGGGPAGLGAAGRLAAARVAPHPGRGPSGPRSGCSRARARPRRSAAGGRSSCRRPGPSPATGRPIPTCAGLRTSP